MSSTSKLPLVPFLLNSQQHLQYGCRQIRKKSFLHLESLETYKPTTWETFSNSSFGRFSSFWFIDLDFILSNLYVTVAENYYQVYWWRPSKNRKIHLFKKTKTQFYRRRRVLYKSGSTVTNASISCRKQRGEISKWSQLYIWPPISRLEI